MTGTTTTTPRRGKASGKRKSKRAASIPPDEYFLPNGFWLQPTAAGVEVNEDTAKRFSAVFGCFKIISESLACVPLLTYKQLEPRGKERARDHRVYKLLKLRPNRWQTSFTFRLTVFGWVVSWGNAYAEIVRNGLTGEMEELHPIHPSLVRPKIGDDGTLVYEVRNPRTGRSRVIRKREMFHLIGPTNDGITGLSPVAAMREGIGLGLAAETFGSAYFGNAAAPSGVIQMPGKVGKNELELFKKKIEDLFVGARKAGKVAFLDNGMTWNPITIPIKDAQYIELRRFQIEEIARIYRVPPFKLQDHSRATFNNVEHLSIDFVTDCLLPWARGFEDAVLRDLLNPEAELMDFSDEYFAEFLFEGLLRGDQKTRYDAYGVAIEKGFMSRNEVRERENLNPFDGGDEYLVPVNMMPASMLGENIKAKAGEASSGDTPDDEDNKERLRTRFRSLFVSAWGRVLRKEVSAVRNAAQKKGDGFQEWLRRFVPEQREFAVSCLSDLAGAYSEALGRADLAGPSFYRMMDAYVEEVALAAAEWTADPLAGYQRDEEKLADYWTDRILNYTGDHATATAA